MSDVFRDLDWRLAKAEITIRARPRLTRGECEALITSAAASLGEPLTRGRFDEYAAAHSAVTHQWIEVEFAERWSEICRRLNINPGARTNRGRRSDLIGAEECFAAVRRCRDFLGWIPTVTEYERWARTIPSVPCASIVRRRCGGWRGVINELRSDPFGAGGERVSKALFADAPISDARAFAFRPINEGSK